MTSPISSIKRHFNAAPIFRMSVALCAWGLATQVFAQLDRVYPQKGSMVSGVVKTIARDEVVVTVGSNDQKVPSNTIRKIIFEGDPTPLNTARSAIVEGQFETAQAELQRVDFAKIARDESKAEFIFFVALSNSKLALAGREDLNKAKNMMTEFVRRYPQSWHFYEAAETLGDIAMAQKSPDAAKYYSALASSPFPEYKLRASYLEGLALQRAGNGEQAGQRFRQVLESQVNSADGVRYQKLAKIGLALALAQTDKADQAIQELNPLIEQNDPADLEVSARLYNAHGFALLKKQDNEGAALAYLHTDLLFSAEADAHVDALKQLIDLWNKLGQPDRAAATRSRLEQLYPGAKN